MAAPDRPPLEPAFSGARTRQPATLRVSNAGTQPDEWRRAVGMPADEFAEAWSNGLQGDPSLYIELIGRGQSKWEFETRVNGKEALHAHGTFNRVSGRLFIDRLRVTDRRHGTGKRFFAQLIDPLAERWGIRTIEVKGGDTDGPHFWSRRGGYIQKAFIESNREDMQNALSRLKDISPPTAAAEAKAILDEGGQDMNVRLARLNATANGQPLAAALMHDFEPRLIFRLDDAEQMKCVHDGLPKSAALSPAIPAQSQPETPKPLPV